MLREYDKQNLRPLIREIGEGHSNSGGDWSVNELLNDLRTKHELNEQEVAYMRVELIKRIPSFRGEL